MLAECLVKTLKQLNHSRWKLTTRLLAFRRKAFADCAGLFQVNVPALLLALLVLQREGEDRAAFLDSVFALSVAGEGGRDHVESG